MTGAHSVCPHPLALPDRPIPSVSLGSCDKLEEVHALLRSTKNLPRSLTGLLLSITSQRLRKISISFMDVVGDEDSNSEDEGDEDDETETWCSLGTTLSHLAEQVSKVEGKLTLRLKFRRLGSKMIKFDHLLSQFLEHGELDVHSTRVFIRCHLGVSPHPSFLFVSNSSTRLHHDSAVEVFGEMVAGRPGVSSRIRTGRVFVSCGSFSNPHRAPQSSRLL